MAKSEVINYEKLDKACKKQERENRSNNKETFSWSLMADIVIWDCCEEAIINEKKLLMRRGWKDYLKNL